VIAALVEGFESSGAFRFTDRYMPMVDLMDADMIQNQIE
jgi:hypothetical protein